MSNFQKKKEGESKQTKKKKEDVALERKKEPAVESSMEEPPIVKKNYSCSSNSTFGCLPEENENTNLNRQPYSLRYLN